MDDNGETHRASKWLKELPDIECKHKALLAFKLDKIKALLGINVHMSIVDRKGVVWSSSSHQHQT